ncbi:MAG: hypothetical protein JXM79_19760 [Sedimentisphaerales bacterium]|nr:hypothetical protein [Sedimentisphaerales bacterium]
MIAVTLVVLAVLTIVTFLMLLIKTVSLSRVKKRLLNITDKFLALEQTQSIFRQDTQRVSETIANFIQIPDTMELIEHRLDELGQKIAESQNLLASLESALQGHETALQGHETALQGHKSTLQRIESILKEHESVLRGYESKQKDFESKQKEHETLLGKAGKMMGKEAAGFTQVVQRIRILEDEFLSLKVFQRTFEITRNQILNVLVGMPINLPPHSMLPTDFKNFNEEIPASSDSKISNQDDVYNPRKNRF